VIGVTANLEKVGSGSEDGSEGNANVDLESLLGVNRSVGKVEYSVAYANDTCYFTTWL
jgi:hypothetical protein